MNFKYKFASKTLSTGLNNTNTYGSNGLPATPNSISIIGYFKSIVERVNSPYLVKYLDCYRNKDETITFISQHHEQQTQKCQFDRLIFCLTSALHFIHFELNTVHGFICPQVIICDSNNVYKIKDWPFNLVTQFGKLLDVQIFLPKNLCFLSPERIIDFERKPTKKSDVWSLALTILYMIDPSIKLPKNPADFLLCKSSKDVLRLLSIKNLPANYETFFSLALDPMIEKRCSSDVLLELLNSQFDDSFRNDLINTKKDLFDDENSHLNNLTINEVYHFWKLSKGNRKRTDQNNFKLSILNLPKLVKLNSTTNFNSYSTDDHRVNLTNNNHSIGEKKIAFLPDTQQILDLDDLVLKLNKLDRKIFYPLLFSKRNDQLSDDETVFYANGNAYANHSDSTSESSILNLPLIIKENDFEYQCERIFLFKRLVNEQPFTRERLKDEAMIDISPYFRAQIWASVLSVTHKDLYIYKRILKETNINTDRQISVDIPRCHQYNELLSSPSGHIKLKKILKAWLKHNEDTYVYWQGLDSLAAPFIMLNFDNEALAFASINNFINRYLEGFFCKDNTPTIQEYLALFAHLIIYHDPELFNHLQELNFTPELYAIPWFLTMFTHVLPLYKVVHIWDTLILHEKSFPLFIGFAILKQLRSQLIGYPFNDCILIFSDLPEINIEQCIKISKLFYEQTPSSLTQRNLITLNDLREEICPRIEIKELIEILSRDNNVLIVDGRNEEEISTLGQIRDSIQIDEKRNFTSFERIRKQDYEFIVVVGNYELAKHLASNNIPRVCTLLGSSLPPDYYELP